MRIFKYLSIVLFVFIGFLVLFHPQYQEFNGYIFNTYYHIKIKTGKIDNDLHQEIKYILEDINNTMSVFVSSSELSKLNQYPAYKQFKLSPDLSYVLKSSWKINQQSNGAFDPAISPLIDLWGFGRNKNHQPLPTSKQIEEVLAYSRFSKLKFSNDFSLISKTDSRTEINLSAIAKGFAVDKIAEILNHKGYKNYIIDIGGEVKASGKRDNRGNGWNIGVGVPQENTLANALVIELNDLAVATSGDYRNFRTIENKKYSHTISPFTGNTVVNNLASVTVFNSSCMEADAYATAIMSMGEKQGREFADKHRLAVIFFIHTENNGFIVKYSHQAQQMLGVYNETN